MSLAEIERLKRSVEKALAAEIQLPPKPPIGFEVVSVDLETCTIVYRLVPGRSAPT